MGGFLVGALLQKHVVLLYCYSCEDDTVKLARHLCEQRQWRIARGYAQQKQEQHVGNALQVTVLPKQKLFSSILAYSKTGAW